MDPWALGAAGADLGGAAVYGLVAQRYSLRTVSPRAHRATLQFALWWYGLAATTAMSGIELLGVGLGVLSLDAAVTIEYLSILVVCAALWGLVGYLVFVYTGRYHLLPLSAGYAVLYVVLVYLVTALHPVGIAVMAGAVTFTFAGTISLAEAVVLVLALLGPELAGIMLYLSLFPRTHDRTTRYRIAVVGGSLLLWWISDLVPDPTSALSGTQWSLILRILGAGAAVGTLVAYYPPRWIQERWHVESAPVGRTASRELDGDL